MSKPARLLKPIVSKRADSMHMWRGESPVASSETLRRTGTKCRAQRHAFTPGTWVIWFGKEYAVVDAADLHDTLEFIP